MASNLGSASSCQVQVCQDRADKGISALQCFPNHCKGSTSWQHFLCIPHFELRLLSCQMLTACKFLHLHDYAAALTFFVCVYSVVLGYLKSGEHSSVFFFYSTTFTCTCIISFLAGCLKAYQDPKQNSSVKCNTM